MCRVRNSPQMAPRNPRTSKQLQLQLAQHKKTNMNLPAEVLLKILQELSGDDVTSSRLISRRFNGVVANNLRLLSRKKFEVIVEEQSNMVVIEHRRCGNRTSKREALSSFDFNRWDQVGVSGLEFRNITSTATARQALENVCSNLQKTRQTNIRSLHLKSVRLDDEFLPVLEKLFNLTLGSCKELLFQDCVLPSALSPETIEKLAVFDHYRWIDSTGAVTANDFVIRKFTSQMKLATSPRSFLAEVNSVAVSSVCEFIETWLSLSSASFFNLSLHGCNEEWKQQFEQECESKKLSHYCLEFASKRHTNAHIKVNFIEESQTCRIWPIFDVPARSAGQAICYARYFRDF